MKLIVAGASWKTHMLIATAGHYFARKLPGFRKQRICVKVKLKPGMQKKEHCRGTATQQSRLTYRIVLDSRLKCLAMIRCLAHEMIHVNQWLTGKMEDVDSRRWKVRWGKRLYRSSMAYRKHPWEIQAHRMDKVLAESLLATWRTR